MNTPTLYFKIKMFLLSSILVLITFITIPVLAATKTQLINQRIANVENKLTTLATIKGVTPPRMTLAERMRFYHVPGVSIALINNGKIEWAKAYGKLESDKQTPVNKDTLFQAASISKAVTAMATLHLVEEHKLHLDMDVNNELVSWKIPANNFTQKSFVTLRDILRHNAGFSVPSFAGYDSKSRIPSLQQILDGEQPANNLPVRIVSTPGTHWAYSGGGYEVLQQLLFDVMKEPFPEMMQRLIFKPLMLTHSTFEQPLPENLSINAASAHDVNGNVIPGKWHVYPELPAAGLWSTPSDLATIAIDLQKSLQSKSGQILSTKMAQKLINETFENDGLGFFIRGTGNARCFLHQGSNEGFKAILVGYINSDQGVAIMTNSENGGKLIPEVVASIAQEYHWPNFKAREHVLAKINPATYSWLTGTYQVKDGPKVNIYSKQHHLFAAFANEAAPSELFPESAKKYFLMNDDTITFTEKNNQPASGFVLRDDFNDDVFIATRIK